MQKKVLLSSILVIALCLSVIAGSTYALFTDKAETSIAITSANVEVTANMDILGVYSAVAQNEYVNDYLVDEYKQNYRHDDKDCTYDAATKTHYFSNGGSAKVNDKGQIEITSITPGDKVNAQIIIKNVGDVDMVYRCNVKATGKLADVMVIDVADDLDMVISDYTTAWTDVVVAPGETVYVDLSFELPVYVGNDYQTEDSAAPVKLTYDITVEAVQGNANTNGIVDVQY